MSEGDLGPELEPTERERDLEVAQMQLEEARDALDEGDLLSVLEAVGDVATWVARSEQRDRPVASVRIERAGDRQDTWTEVYPGESKEIDLHGKVNVRVQGAEIGLHAEVDPDE